MLHRKTSKVRKVPYDDRLINYQAFDIIQNIYFYNKRLKSLDLIKCPLLELN